LFREATEIWNQGQSAREDGRTRDYQKALLESWDALERMYAALEPYTDWFEEADLEGWAMPAYYGVLQKRLDLWDGFRAKVKKLKPVKLR